MPLLGTRGALSSRGFGLLAGVDGPYWAATLGGSGGEYGRAVAVDTFGNVYAAGYSYPAGTGADVLVTKYSISGAIQWQRLLAGTYTDLALDMATDPSGNVYVIGYVGLGSGSSTDQILIVKYDTNGTLQWQRRFGDPFAGSAQVGNGVFVDFFGNVYITGYAQGGDSIVIVKYNTNGVLQSERIFGTSPTSYNEGFGVAVDASGNIYIAGATSSTSPRSAFVMKLDSLLTIQWQRRLTSAYANDAFAITIDSSANVYITGEADSASTSDLLIAKYNTSGTLQWQRRLIPDFFITGWGIAIDAANRLYVSTRGSFSGNIYIASYNSSGTILWQREFGGGSTDEDAKIAVTPLGEIAIGATTYSVGSNGEMLILRLPGNGTRTGTYGPWTYQASTFTDAAGSLTDAAASLIIAGGYSPVSNAAGMLGSTATYTSTVTPI